MKEELLTRSKDLGSFKVPRILAQGTYKISEKHKKQFIRNGKVVKRNPTTIIDEKISDTCIQIFQDSNIAKKFDYKILRENALKALEEKFTEHNLVIDNKKSKFENEEIIKKREIAIHQWTRKYIEENANLVFTIDFDTFINLTGVKTAANRLDYALQMLCEIQSKASYEYKIPVLLDDFFTINYEFKSVAAIPNITLVLDEEMGEKYPTLSSFAEAKIQNKKRHIKSLSFEINKSYVSAIIGVGTDYTQMNRKERNKFKSTYSFRLDTRLRSIMRVQYNKIFNRHTFNELQSILGTNFAEYRYFKKLVLLPSIEDLNAHTDYNVELVEERKDRKIAFISFSITMKNKKASNLKFGVNKIAYYITSRMFYFGANNKNKIIHFTAFAKSVEKELNNPGLFSSYDGIPLSKWIEEANEECKYEIELLDFIDRNRQMFESANIEYDERRMCLVEKTITPKEESLALVTNLDTEESPTDDEHTICTGNVEYENKTKIIKIAKYIVNNPSSSLKYINDVLLQKIPKELNVIDCMPFSIFTSMGTVLIDGLEVFAKHKDVIFKNIADKNLSFFAFDKENMFKEVFIKKVLNESFKEVTKDFREMIEKLTNYK